MSTQSLMSCFKAVAQLRPMDIGELVREGIELYQLRSGNLPLPLTEDSDQLLKDTCIEIAGRHTARYLDISIENVCRNADQLYAAIIDKAFCLATSPAPSDISCHNRHS
jgi:hypothetical protein